MKMVKFRQTEDVCFRASCESWKSDHWLTVQLRVRQESLVRASFRFFRKGEEKPAFVVTQKLLPDVRITAGFPLSVLASQSFFLEPRPGQYKSTAHGRPCSIGEMEAVELVFEREAGLTQVEISEACVTDAPRFPVEGEVFVDMLGQIAKKNWPGKTHSAEELVSYLRSEREKAVDEYPEGFSRYGGWLDKRFESTGWFHTRHDGRRWWLVDPEGCAFVSHGICYGNRMGIYTFIDGMKSLCEWLPDRNDPLYSQAYMTADQDPEFSKRNGVETGKDRWMFNFSRANMMHAFGDDWWNAWADINGARLKAWGINTLGVGVGNYPDERTLAYLEKVQIPFVWSLIDFPKPSSCIFRDFPDVFSREYAELSEDYAKQLLPLRDNPMLIGYFLTNEPEWLFEELCLSERLLASRQDFASKHALVRFLIEKYTELSALNAAWKTEFESFDDLLVPLEHADRLSDLAAADLHEFDEVLIEMYSRVPSDALRRVDPNHLNLGMRYSQFKPVSVPGFRHFDVFSFNCYRDTCSAKSQEAYRLSDLPTIVGEWHIGGYDRGLLGSGLVQAASQEERAKAISYYLEQGVAEPSVVGLHYFELFDQPPLGRFDGATGQSGLIDICNRPYAECDRALREFAVRMYLLADGRIEPTQEMGALEDRIY
ncbi:beta-galactosidase [Paenibacillus puerhi]|uniref:beta-galactosidase n=1 Tax=Paenibacillus puerhi TaxID=2692622 RepID=UPI00135B7E18|nr:beta-galactosidase [Paenibacillus puerhi]